MKCLFGPDNKTNFQVLTNLAILYTISIAYSPQYKLSPIINSHTMHYGLNSCTGYEYRTFLNVYISSYEISFN